MKSDTITIVVKGPKKFRQEVINKIYEILMEQDMQEAAMRPGCSIDLDSSIAPSDDVMW